MPSVSLVATYGQTTIYIYIYIYIYGRRHLAAKVGTSKGGGKQWQTIPKNLPRMQCARAIPSHDWALVPAKAEY